MEAQQRLLCEAETRLGEYGIHKTSLLCLLNASNLSVICGISGSVLYAFLFRSKKGGFGISENEKHKNLKVFVAISSSGETFSSGTGTRVQILFANGSASFRLVSSKLLLFIVKYR
jgi:hypothetical protein